MKTSKCSSYGHKIFWMRPCNHEWWTFLREPLLILLRELSIGVLKEMQKLTADIRGSILEINVAFTSSPASCLAASLYFHVSVVLLPKKRKFDWFLHCFKPSVALISTSETTIFSFVSHHNPPNTLWPRASRVSERQSEMSACDRDWSHPPVCHLLERGHWLARNRILKSEGIPMCRSRWSWEHWTPKFCCVIFPSRNSPSAALPKKPVMAPRKAVA